MPLYSLQSTFPPISSLADCLLHKCRREQGSRWHSLVVFVCFLKVKSFVKMKSHKIVQCLNLMGMELLWLGWGAGGGGTAQALAFALTSVSISEGSPRNLQVPWNTLRQTHPTSFPFSRERKLKALEVTWDTRTASCPMLFPWKSPGLVSQLAKTWRSPQEPVCPHPCCSREVPSWSQTATGITLFLLEAFFKVPALQVQLRDSLHFRRPDLESCNASCWMFGEQVQWFFQAPVISLRVQEEQPIVKRALPNSKTYLN